MIAIRFWCKLLTCDLQSQRWRSQTECGSARYRLYTQVRSLVTYNNFFKKVIKMTKNEYIKAELDLMKLFISAILAAAFLIAVYNLQTGGVHVFNTTCAVIVLAFALSLASCRYLQIAKKLLE